MANKYKKNDIIKIITGKNKGVVSHILKYIPKINKVLIKGVNVVKKHTKPNKSNKEGGIIKKEMPIDISNILHFNIKKKHTSKIGFKCIKNIKFRYLKKTDELIYNKK
jgi:large subunit ribosomal protein L24